MSGHCYHSRQCHHYDHHHRGSKSHSREYATENHHPCRYGNRLSEESHYCHRGDHRGLQTANPGQSYLSKNSKTTYLLLIITIWYLVFFYFRKYTHFRIIIENSRPRKANKFSLLAHQPRCFKTSGKHDTTTPCHTASATEVYFCFANASSMARDNWSGQLVPLMPHCMP